MTIKECKNRKRGYKKLIEKVLKFEHDNRVSECPRNQLIKKEFLFTPGQWELIELALVRSLAIEELNLAELKKGTANA